MLAFMLNWSQALLQGAGAAGVAFIGAEYLNLVLLPPGQRGPRAVLASAAALMLVLLALNYAGVRAGARTQNVLSVAKLAMIAGLAVCALALAPPAADTPAPPVVQGQGWTAFAAAAVAVFYTYGGYQCAMNLGGDVRDARRNLPRAVTAGMLGVVGAYLLVNVAYERALGLGGVAASPLVAAALARATFGPLGEQVVALAIFLSAAGFVNAAILHMPRSYYAMAEDGALPRAFLRVNPRTQVQELGTLFFGFTMLAPALVLGSFEKLLSYVMFSDALALAIVAGALFVLRHRARGAEIEGVFRMPGYPWLPALFTLTLLGIALRVLVSETALALAGLGILLAGAPLFVFARRWNAAGGPPGR
jgi:APA family basic amino acid/polyamine antiporter